jgi:hypothetical protein
MKGIRLLNDYKSSSLTARLVLLLGLPLVLPAQAPKTSPNLSGLWELRFDSRNVPQASLSAEGSAVTEAQQTSHDTHAIRWCYNLGVPFLMEQSPIDIVQNLNGKEIVITFPYRGPSRHIYTDGRTHVNPDIYDPSSSGDSIGHWEGDTLVVDTIGFSEEGVTRIPGGGRRTPASHLMERYRLVSGGKQLSVTFTWEDPKVFAKPHTYEFRYYRAPKGMEAREYDCNASDEERAKFLLGTPGK